MKLLLDENLSRRLVPYLQKDFPESTQVTLVGLETASDIEFGNMPKSMILLSLPEMQIFMS